jgi:hypothetical protein
MGLLLSLDIATAVQHLHQQVMFLLVSGKKINDNFNITSFIGDRAPGPEAIKCPHRRKLGRDTHTRAHTPKKINPHRHIRK